jgi:hypothetical protein
MADGGMDPCECIWNHEMAMQRLMNLLRNSQSFCSDNECIQDGGPSVGDSVSAGGFSTMMLVMFGWLIVATALFLLRPSSLRRNPDQKPSPSHDGGGNNPAPPAPPVC